MLDTTTTIDLDHAQRSVVDHASGALCVFGGPGTGKTQTLEERFVRLALSPGCSPDRILFLVPNRAQKIALQDRLTRRLLLEEDVQALIEVPVYTWHGLANHLVSRHYDRLAYPEPPVLLTSPEHWGDVRDALASENEANWPHHRLLLQNRGFVDEVVDFCIRAEQRLLDPSQLDALADARPAWAEVIRFFNAHRERLRKRSRVDYPSLLADAAELVANHDDVRESLQERFLHVLVDDGQELALVQRRLLHFLTQGGADRSFVLAGDPDSAIETFRGADPEWMGDFDRDFGAHKTVVLETSYRLGKTYGRQVDGLIAHNGLSDTRPTAFAGHSTLEVHRFGNFGAEAVAICRALRHAHLTDRVPYDDMAILLTSPRSMLPPLERALDALEVPFSISAPDRPLAREPIVGAFGQLARFAFAEDPDDAGVAQLLRSPLIGLDDANVRELEREARVTNRSLAAVVAAPESLETGEETQGKLRELIELAGLMRAKQEDPADEAFWVLWERSQLCNELQAKARTSLADPANRELDAIVAFSRALGRFVERRRGTGTFSEYLDGIARADFGSDPWLPPERAGAGVAITSFHGAKGRQWTIVAVAGVVEGSIPKGHRATGLFDPYFLDETDPVTRFRKNEMEDRRVFYVAATRATARCIITTSPGPSRRGEPSRFIEELTGEMPQVEIAGETPPLTFSEAAARYRKTLSAVDAEPGERLAALAALTRIHEVDPACKGANPAEWWWRWDWTEGATPIRVQQNDPEDNLPLDKLRTSYSRISTYDNCGLQYLLSVVLGLDPESSHNMAFGSWIHKVFEEFENGTLPIDLGLANVRFDELFDRSVFPNKAMARQFYSDGQLMIARYLEYMKPGEAERVEYAFRVERDGHRITGRIDRIDRIGKNLIIQDYKTSRSAAQWDEARESLQLAIYYLAVKSDPELAALGKPSSMQLIYPGAPLSRGSVAKRCQTPDEAEKAILKLPRLIDGVLAEDFRPNPEADCKWCRFKPLCPLWSEGRELPA
ncbi:MAG: ATP-dependent helicase [Actinomycetota bacterium]|nr:ATP-dependent helicase [Actinomycetota bacterium]